MKWGIFALVPVVLLLTGCGGTDPRETAIAACTDWVADQIPPAGTSPTLDDLGIDDLAGDLALEFCDPDRDPEFVQNWTDESFVETMHQLGGSR